MKRKKHPVKSQPQIVKFLLQQPKSKEVKKWSIWQKSRGIRVTEDGRTMLRKRLMQDKGHVSFMRSCLNFSRKLIDSQDLVFVTNKGLGIIRKAFWPHFSG